ncbi:putative isomerase [Granulicella sibirica]|uniref:Putative isomerase n=2 Tax=Granulicella sibirica TaxID=2479048 RepID=A0A4Q0T686_9BACT|nr:putative isomerase [Granulicella sibirica]
MTKEEVGKLYGRYVKAWKAISVEKRMKILEDVFAADVQYLVPEFQGGREAALEDMAGFQEKFPGAHFEVTEISAHHDVALMTWVLVQLDGTHAMTGHDSLRISSEGKIVNLITFGPSVAMAD